MQFRLKHTLIAIAVIALLMFVANYVYVSWIKPGNVGELAQDRLDAFFKEANIDGFSRVLFYFYEVQIVGKTIDYDDVKRMEPILKDIYWLKVVDVTETSIRGEDLKRLQEEFSPILVWRREDYDDA